MNVHSPDWVDPETGLTMTELTIKAHKDMGHRTASALALHRAFRGDAAVARNSLLTYRCKRRCLLLDIYNTPEGLAFYLPPFKLSPEQNKNTDENARIERTSDGTRRWIERADLLDTLGHSLTPWLNCDHVKERPFSRAEIRDTLRNGTREVTV